MKKKNRWALTALAAAAAVSGATPCWAAAPMIKGWINGSAYQFSYVTGSYNSNATLLRAQPWWGDAATAALSQEAVKLKLGGITTSSAAALSGALVTAVRWSDADYATETKFISKTNTSITWLTATPIAAPEIDGGKLPMAMMLMGLLYYFGIRRKNQAPA